MMHPPVPASRPGSVMGRLNSEECIDEIDAHSFGGRVDRRVSGGTGTGCHVDPAISKRPSQSREARDGLRLPNLGFLRKGDCRGSAENKRETAIWTQSCEAHTWKQGLTVDPGCERSTRRSATFSGQFLVAGSTCNDESSRSHVHCSLDGVLPRRSPPRHNHPETRDLTVVFRLLAPMV